MEEKFLIESSRESFLEPQAKNQDQERVRDSAVIGSWLYDNDKSIKTQLIYKKTIAEFYAYFLNPLLKPRLLLTRVPF